MKRNAVKTNTLQNILRITLGLFMILAATGHLTFLRKEFQAQVPDWVPMDKDMVVILSGVVELLLGLGMLFSGKRKIEMGIILAVFYILVFPGNIAQYLNETDALGLDTDQKRLIRLFFQPLLILATLWSTGVFHSSLRKDKSIRKK
ncbi:MAG: hypothetical protein LBQ60_18930 [Bacteroidales bacterium]|jgi:uncharacterized membrane protein|nr:hypothetical protein [Bacteroidales bacterium]